MRVSDSMMLGELQTQFGITDNGVLYLLRDEFYTAESAPIASPRNAEPIGVLTIVQTDGQYSINSGGQLVVPSQATPLDGDQGFYGAALARTSGRALLTKFNSSTASGGNFPSFGWSRSASAAAAQMDTMVYVATGQLAVAISNASGVNVGAIANNTDYQLAIVERATGFFIFLKGGAFFTAWTLVWVAITTTTATLYPAFANYSGTLTIDYFRVTDLLGAFATEALHTFTIAPSQSLGSELLTNGNMETGSPPTGWTTNNVTLTGVADERTGGAGVQSANISILATRARFIERQSGGATNDILEVNAWFKNIDATTGVWVLFNAGTHGIGGTYSTDTSWIRRKGIVRLGADTNVRGYVSGSVIGQQGRIDDVSIKKITLNAAQTADANSITHLTFTVPASPVAGDQIHIYIRISAAGDELLNCWDAYLIRNDTNTAWDFKYDSINAGVRTNRITVSNVTADAIAVITNLNGHDCYTKNATNWTKRGSTISSSLYSTATLCNCVYTSGFTAGSLTEWPLTSSLYDLLSTV